jgi:predicted dehydrogenase
MQPIGVAVHGAGWVSGEHIKSYLKNPLARVVAISSRKRESAEARAREAGLGSVKIYDRYEDLLADPEVQAVSLCTPPNLHPQETIQAAEAGKHILIEKAVANDVKSLRAMQAAVKRAGVKTVVSFVLRWNPQFMWIRRMLEEGAIGSIVYAEVDYWHEIGPWYGQYAWNIKRDIARSSFLSAGCHAVDAIRWFVRDEIEEVCAYSNRPNKEYEYDTNVLGIVKFKGGAIGKLSSCLDVKAPYQFNIDLLGDRGTIRDNRIYAKEWLAGQMDWMEIPTIRPDSGDVRHHPFDGELSHFLDCIANNVESHVNLEDAAKTHEVCFAMNLSSESGGKPVRIADLDTIG